MIKQNEKRETFINMLIWLFLSLLFLQYLTACSFKVEFGYHGESAKDNRDYTQQKSVAKY